MRLRCDRASLVEALGVVGSAIPNQAPAQVVLNVLLQLGPKGLTLRGTDLSVFVQLEVLEVKEGEPGAALLPFNRFLALLREIDSQEVELVREQGVPSVKVETERDRFEVVGRDPEDFPAPPIGTEVRGLKVDGAVLLEALASVDFAAARDAARQQLRGVGVVLQGKKVHVIATDGRRLAEYVLSSSTEEVRRKEGIVPLGSVECIERFLAFVGEEVEFKLDPEQKQVVVSHGRGCVVCRLLEGQMPNYIAMIPGEFAATVEGSARTLLQAVRKAGVLTTKEEEVVFVKVEEGRLFLEVSSHDVGFGVVAVQDVEVRGEDLKAGFSVRFLMDGLRVLGDRQVRFGINKGSVASVMHSGRSFRYGFMPIVFHEGAL